MRLQAFLRSLFAALPFSRHPLQLMILLLGLTACSGSVIIVNELEERYANEIIVFLANERIDAEKLPNVASKGAGNTGPTTWNISVARGDRMRALTLLNNNGLPRRRAQNLLDLFEKQGLVSSQMEEKIRYQSGRCEQIASTIRKIDGVLDADVQVSFPLEDPLPGQQAQAAPITASVYVKHQGVLADPNSHLVLKIKRLVADAIQGLDFDHVTVIEDRAIFNNPHDLSTEPELRSVWGVRVVSTYVGQLQIILLCLILVAFLALSLAAWVMWKASALIPMVGGWISLLSLTRWNLVKAVEPPAPAPAAPTPTPAATPPQPPIPTSSGAGLPSAGEPGSGSASS